MINNYIKNCSLTIRLVVLVVFLTAVLPLIAGCSSFSTISKTTKRITRNIKAPDRNLKKKIGVAFFENKTSIVDQKLEENFLNYLVENLKKPCSDLIMVQPGDSGYPDFLIDLPRQASGLIDNFNLAKAGKRFGLNAIITSALTNIRKNRQERGFWWFKKTDHYVQVEVVVAVYDTITGAKLLDENFTHKIETEDIEGELVGNDVRREVPAWARERPLCGAWPQNVRAGRRRPWSSTRTWCSWRIAGRGTRTRSTKSPANPWPPGWPSPTAERRLWGRGSICRHVWPTRPWPTSSTCGGRSGPPIWRCSTRTLTWSATATPRRPSPRPSHSSR